jgi:hypothetical protein
MLVLLPLKTHLLTYTCEKFYLSHMAKNDQYSKIKGIAISFINKPIIITLFEKMTLPFINNQFQIKEKSLIIFCFFLFF